VRGFYEDYIREKQAGQNQSDRPHSDRSVMIRQRKGTAVLAFIRKLFTAVIYLAASALSSVGLTTLINKPLRDMLLELVTKTFSAS
jgi:hypothetical protein